MGDKLTYKDYIEVANMSSEEEDFWALVKYDFAIHLQVGDRIYLTDEDEDVWSPFICNVQLGDIKDFFRREFEVVRRDFTCNGLWIIIEEVEE